MDYHERKRLEDERISNLKVGSTIHEIRGSSKFRVVKYKIIGETKITWNLSTDGTKIELKLYKKDLTVYRNKNSQKSYFVEIPKHIQENLVL